MAFFKEKIIWLTGAGSGIGQALAIELSKAGAQLILSGRNLDNLKKTQAILSNPTNTTLIPLDLSDHDGLQTIFEDNVDLLSKVDILINNAGVSQRSLAINTDFEVYKRLMDVNYLGTVKLSLMLLKYFKLANKGHFVVVTSSAGKFGVPLRTGYSGSKFALHGFFEALRAELSETNINITIVCPGFITTDISKNALTADGTPQNKMDKAQKNGMPASVMARKTMKAIESNKAEILIGGFKETKMAVWLSRIFPSIFRKIIAKADVT